MYVVQQQYSNCNSIPQLLAMYLQHDSMYCIMYNEQYYKVHGSYLHNSQVFKSKLGHSVFPLKSYSVHERNKIVSQTCINFVEWWIHRMNTIK